MPIADERASSVECAAAAFSRNGQIVASSQISEYQGIRPSYGAAKLRLWERETGQELVTLAPIVTHILAFSPNSRLLASGGQGFSGHLQVGYGSGLEVWDVLTGKKVASLPTTPSCVAFSPDGRRIATGGRDRTVLVWEAPSPERLPVKAPIGSPNEREDWWNALAGSATDSLRATAAMIDAPDRAVAAIAERLIPVPAADPKEVVRMIAELDDESFPVRQKAAGSLAKLGEGASHLIAKALAGDLSLAVRRSLEGISRKSDETSVRSLQEARAVATLEQIASPAARDLLRRLAEGAPNARLTAEAQEALGRLPE
jgi:hypothetical protein